MAREALRFRSAREVFSHYLPKYARLQWKEAESGHPQTTEFLLRDLRSQLKTGAAGKKKRVATKSQ